MSDKLNFEAKDKTLREVLFSDRKYCVPRYQRPYAWDIEQVSEFWDDLVSSKEPYFLGSFIFNIENEKETGYADIIDGQQRLLTVTIFMAVLRDLAKHLDEGTAKLYQRKDIAIEDRKGIESFRVCPGDTLQSYFEKYIQIGKENIQDSKPTRREELRVKDNYDYLYDKVSLELQRFESHERRLNTLSRLRDQVTELIVIDVEITKEEDAYEIFETTNARGIDLSVGDLLKNLIFKNIPVEKDRDLAKDIWQDITSNVEATGTELKRFIRYFWISRHTLISEKRVYREIKRNTTDWQDLLDDLWDDSMWYNQLLEGTEANFQDLKQGYKIYEAVFALRLMRVSQCYILLLSILRNYSQLGTDPTRIFQMIEKFTFQYSVVCRRPGNRVEKIYSRFALDIENAIRHTSEKKLPGKIQSIFSQLEKELKSITPSEQAFKESFAEFSYRNSEQRRKLVKYVLDKFDRYFRIGDEYRVNFDHVNIEHVLPINPSKEWGLEKSEIREYVNLLGNLTLLSKVLNSQIQNGPISKKIPKLGESDLAITKNLVQILTDMGGEWGRDQIVERQDFFADLAYNHIWTL